MALVSGSLIEIADYNDLALAVNNIYSEGNINLAYTTSNLIHNTLASGAGESAGAVKTLAPTPVLGDFIVAIVNNITLIDGVDYTIDYGLSQITYIGALAANAVLKVYNRNSHKIGWGQQASVYPISAGDPILADEAVLQAYLEANVNNLIDKTNIMTERVGSVVELTRVAEGALIFATDTTTITSTINAEVLTGNVYHNNDIATVSPSVNSFTRTETWETLLVGIFEWKFTDYNQFRYFFNTGSEIRCNVAMTGDIQDSGYNNWSQVVNTMGSLIIDHDTAGQTGTNGITSNIGAYELTSIFQTIYTSGSPAAPVDGDGTGPGVPGPPSPYGDYSNLVLKFEAKIDETGGTFSVQIRVTLDDTSFINQDIVGTTTLNAGYKLADNITDNSVTFVNTAFTPTISVIEDFTTNVYTPPITSNTASYSTAGLTSGSSIPDPLAIDVGDLIMNIDPEILGNSAQFVYDGSTAIYVNGGETFSTSDSIKFQGASGIGNTGKVTITFIPKPDISVSEQVNNLSFRISDLDKATSGRDEQIVIEAYDNLSNPVAFTITPGSNLTVTTGDTVNVNTVGDASPSDASNSMLVQMTGPVATIVATYSNQGSSAQHWAWFSEVAFDTIPI